MDYLKAEAIGNDTWRVLAIPFGGPFEGKDFDGEYFDAKTDIKPRWFKARPVIFDHGTDPSTKDEEYGEQVLDDEPSEDGWWGTIQLNTSARYWGVVNKLLNAGKMFGSSGTIGHLVRTDRKTGHIEVWPHVEQSLTVHPSNFYSRITAAKAIADFDHAGISLDDPFKAAVAELDRLAADLRPGLPDPGDATDVADLGEGGEDAAMKRLVESIPSVRPDNPYIGARLALAEVELLRLRRKITTTR